LAVALFSLGTMAGHPALAAAARAAGLDAALDAVDALALAGRAGVASRYADRVRAKLERVAAVAE
jgi:hypothetical protein